MPCLHMRLHEAPVSQRARSPKSRAPRHPHGVQASTACSSTACGLITPSTPRPLSRRRLPRPPLGFSLHAPQTYTSRASHALHRWTHLQRRGNPYRAFSHGQSLSSRTALHSHPLRSPSPTPRPVAQQPDSRSTSHPLRSQSLISRTALHSHPLHAIGHAISQAIGHAISHAIGHAILHGCSTSCSHANHGPPSGPRCDLISHRESQRSRVAPTSCSHSHMPPLFRLTPSFVDGGVSDHGWFHHLSDFRTLSARFRVLAF